MAETQLDIGVAREALQAGLGIVGRVLPAKAVLPVLTHVLVQTVEGGMEVTASDMDQSIKTLIPADVGMDTGATVALPGKRLTEIVRELPPGAVRIEGTDTAVKLKAGKSNFRLLTHPASEFPALPQIPFGSGWRVNAASLAEAIGRTAFAVSTEESRPMLNGVLMELEGADMRLVATNGHRLAMYHIPGARVDTGDTVKHQLIVPPMAMETIRKMIERLGENDSIEIATTENHLGTQAAGTTATTRLISGPYPNYTGVIPKEHEHEAVIDKADLTALVKRMATVTGDRRRIALSFDGDRCLGEAAEADVGEAGDECPMTKYTGQPMRIGFNVDYLLEVLRNMPGETVSIEMSSPVKAVVFRPVDTLPRNATYMCLIMPLRLDS